MDVWKGEGMDGGGGVESVDRSRGKRQEEGADKEERREESNPVSY